MKIKARPYFVLEAKGRISPKIRRFLGEQRVGFMHAHKDGSPVLKDDGSWRTINGVYVNAFGGWATLVFRRFE